MASTRATHATPKTSTLQKEVINSNASAASSSSSVKLIACCPQCHNLQSVFFCSICLSERLILQHVDNRRLREARQKARSRVEALLGLVEIPKSLIVQATLPDPFVEPGKRGQRRKYSSPITASHHGASVQDCAARATRFKLETDIQCHLETIQRLQTQISMGRKRLMEKRKDLSERRSLLEKAKRHVMHNEEQEVGALPEEVLSAKKIDFMRELVTKLQAEEKQVANNVARVRASLARQAFSLFNVCAPSSSLASTRNNSDRIKATTSSNRTQRSKERYSAGAFAIDFTNAFDLGRSSHSREDKAKGGMGNVNDWTILGLVLPLPSDIRRFDRLEINGAISHTIQLLQLIIAYLGITLPFVVTMQGNVPQIRANPLWGAGVKENLHLSQSTHSALIASGGGGNTATLVGGMGASMMSTLGASTLSTLESFVQLPSGKNLPWAKNTLEPSSSKDEAAGQTSRATEAPLMKDSATLNGKRFCSALTMLSYDVAYLAHLQDVKVDLVMAAGSTLRLLSKAIQSTELGKKSHTSHRPSSNIATLQFAAIDFAQLLQVHEPGFSSGSNNSVTGEQLNNKAIMEGSYVDAKKAAESILDLKQKSVISSVTASPAVVTAAAITTTTTTTTSPALSKAATSAQNKDKMSSLAAKRVPSTLPVPAVAPPAPLKRGAKPHISTATKAASTSPANTLDFLRARGQREQKEKPQEATTKKSSITTQVVAKEPIIPAASGTIIFNGKEIRGKTKSPSKLDTKKYHEEGWHVL